MSNLTRSSIFDDSSSDDEAPQLLEQGNDKEKVNESQEGLELKQTKKQRKMKPVNDELLISQDGIARVYDEFPRVCEFRGRGHEKQDLKKLMDAYREWAFQLHPGVSSADFFLKCESLSSSSRVKNHLQEMRSDERNRYLTEIQTNSLNSYH